MFCLQAPPGAAATLSHRVRQGICSKPGVVACRYSRRVHTPLRCYGTIPAGRGMKLRVRSSTLSSDVPSSRSDVFSSSTSSGSDNSAVYVRHALAAGDLVKHQCSVVVVGEVPEGAIIVSTGDIVIMGWLKGEVQAGHGGNRGAMVSALQTAASAKISIAGISAPRQPGTALMAVLQADAQVVTFQALPGSEALQAPAPSLVSGIESGQVAGALVLALGLGLAVAPAAVLGTLLHSGAESVTAALLEVAVYGYILLQGATLLGDGSELLLEILNPGIIGGVVLPVLGAVPDSLIILNSGLHAAPEDAQQEVAVGVGTLAGSTILLLSLAWGGSVLLGRCDLDDQGAAKDKTLTRTSDVLNTGVTVDDDVRQGALIMAISVLGYAFVQVPAVLGSPDDPTAALIGSVTCLAAAVGYCVYSVVVPERQRRRIEAARKERFRQYAVKALALQASDLSKYGGLVDSTGSLNLETAENLFEEFDADKSGVMDMKELSGLLKGLQLNSHEDGMGSAEDDLKFLFQEFDLNKDEAVTKDEFTKVLGKWVTGHYEPDTALLRMDGSAQLLAGLPLQDVAALQAIAADLDSQSPAEAAEDMEAEEAHRPPPSASEIALQASLRLGAGVTLCAVFSDPLVDALTSLSRETGIPPFFAGFVLTPFASNASEVISSLNFAARKRKKNMSLTFSQVYGAVTMNNSLVLGLFLLVVYLKRLEWVYSSEVLVIVGGSLLIGFLGYTRSTIKTVTGFSALAIYPASLAIIYVLDTYFGWQ